MVGSPGAGLFPTLGPIAGSVNIQGGDDFDTLNIIDGENSPKGHNYKVFDIGVTSWQMAGIFHNDLEVVNLQAGSGPDTIDIVTVAPWTSLHIAGNDGDDDIHVSLNELANVSLTLAGNDGADTLTLTDNTDAGLTLAVAGDHIVHNRCSNPRHDC